MQLRLPPLGPVRPPFIAGLFALLLLGGAVALEHFGKIALPGSSDDLTAAVLPGAVVALTNEEREDRDLPMLTANALLSNAAQLKADDMAAKSYYAHVSPDGTVPPYWLDRVGYKYQIMAENLVIDRPNADAVVSAWMGSSNHRENILNPVFTEIGIGVAHGVYKEQKTTYVVQMLAKPQTPRQAAPAPAPRTVRHVQPVTPTPVPTRTAATTKTLVTAPARKPVVRDPIALIFETVAQTIATTASFTLPNIVASTTYLPPVLALDTSEPIEIGAPATAAPEIAPQVTLRGRARAFVGSVVFQLRSFFRP